MQEFAKLLKEELSRLAPRPLPVASVSVYPVIAATENDQLNSEKEGKTTSGLKEDPIIVDEEDEDVDVEALGDTEEVSLLQELVVKQQIGGPATKKKKLVVVSPAKPKVVKKSLKKN